MNHEKERKQEALGEHKIIHPTLHLSITVYASIMLYLPTTYICNKRTNIGVERCRDGCMILCSPRASCLCSFS